MKSLALGIGFLILLAGCTSSVRKLTKGMQTLENPRLYYRLYTDDASRYKPKAGDEVWIHYSIGTASEVLASSYETVPVLVPLPTETQDIFFTKSLRLMGEGDSLFALVQADDIREHLGEHSSRFKKGDWVYFRYKNLKINTLQEVQAERARLAAKADSLRKTTQYFAYRCGQRADSLLQSLPQTASGLRYQILDAGAGAALNKGDLVAVHYVCVLSGGQAVEDSYASGQPLEFAVGGRSVIAGWEEGVRLLRRGGSALLVIPPALGYGEQGAPPQIPANATLVFYIEVQD